MSQPSKEPSFPRKHFRKRSKSAPPTQHHSLSNSSTSGGTKWSLFCIPTRKSTKEISANSSPTPGSPPPPSSIVPAPAPHITITISEPNSDPPVPPELSTAPKTPLVQGTCTRTCIIWHKSLGIAEQKLSRLKLPPLDQEHLKRCSHNSGSREVPASNIVTSAVQELQTIIETKHPSGSEGGMKRMKNLLQTFSKYAAIIDVAVNHSPRITALVWAGIRLTLQVR